MSKSAEEVRRERFEAWVATRHAVNKHTFARRGDGVYAFNPANKWWDIWNAVHDGIVIELPERDAKGSGSPDSEMGASLEQYEAVAYSFALDDCRAAIEQTGLGLKVK